MSKYTIPIDMSDVIYDFLLKEITKSYPKMCLLWVERVSNLDLEGRYQNIVEDLGKDAKEYYGWHGTDAALIDTITAMGFDPEKNTRSAYGKGTYIARNASYSTAYARKGFNDIAYMFYCKLVTKGFVQGKMHKEIVKPYVGVNDLSSPTIYAVPDKDAVIPTHVVAFYPEAKW